MNSVYRESKAKDLDHGCLLTSRIWLAVRCSVRAFLAFSLHEGYLSVEAFIKIKHVLTGPDGATQESFRLLALHFARRGALGRVRASGCRVHVINGPSPEAAHSCFWLKLARLPTKGHKDH